MQPDVVPVGFDFDGEYFFAGGINILESRKYKNVLKNSKVALVIDDLKIVDPWGGRASPTFSTYLSFQCFFRIDTFPTRICQS